MNDLPHWGGATDDFLDGDVSAQQPRGAKYFPTTTMPPEAFCPKLAVRFPWSESLTAE
jgi:hypothetical protein